MTPADKRWLRKMVREEFRLVIEEMLAEGAQQVGGYDGATNVTDSDDCEGRIGFQISHRKDANVTK